MITQLRDRNILRKSSWNTFVLRFAGFSLAALVLFLGMPFGGAVLGQSSGAKIIDAAYSEIVVDGEIGDWAKLSSGVVTMDTKGRGSKGTLAVDVKYAWDYTNVY